jgi:hypothetical protein
MEEIYPIPAAINAKLKHPFRPLSEYDIVKRYPDGGMFLGKFTENRLTKKDVAYMVEINRQAALKQLAP